MNGDPQSSETIFGEAIDIAAADERAAYLDRACENDPELRGVVEQLVVNHFRAGRFLDQPVAQFAATIDLPGEPPIGEKSGTQIGPYKLLQQIGEGGMGTVFMAEQTHPVQRKVALKVIKPGMDSRQVIARFEAERQALAMMDHVNIARVLDAGATESGRPYFVMELVNGVPITRYCDDNQLTPRQRLELFVPVCQAIQHAHQKGIIHRDVKPSNVMITLYDGKPVPKVIDFGVAKATEQKITERTLFTQYGSMVGTLEYMSPEQAERSALGADTRSDIYSLGVLLYELLTGSTPLIHKRVREVAYGEILRMIRDEEPPKPSTRLTDSGEALASISAQRHMEPANLTKLVKGELDWIAMKALEKDRNRRYETVSAFAADVQRYLNDEAVHACPPSAWYRFRKFARRNKAALVTAGVLAIALSLGTAISTWQAIRAGRAETAERAQRQEAEDSRQQAVGDRDLALQAEEHARLRLYEARLAQAKASRWSGRMGQRFESLAILKEAAEIARERNMPPERFQELRNEAIACMALPDVEIVKELRAWTNDDLNLDFDPPFERYAVSDKQGNVVIRRVSDNEELARLPGPGYATGVWFSPDGALLLVYDGRDVQSSHAFKVWKLAGAKPEAVLEETRARTGIDFSPDSRRLAFVREDGTICVYDLAARRLLWNKDLCPGAYRPCLCFHPEEPLLAVTGKTALQFRDPETGADRGELPPHPARINSVAWHPDGRTLAVACDDLKIYLWEMPARKQKQILEGHKDLGIWTRFTPSGDLLLTGDWHDALRLWDARSGRQVLKPAIEQHWGYLRCGPGARPLVAVINSGKLCLARITRGEEFRTLVRNPSPQGGKAFNQVSIHPDGRLLVASVASGQPTDGIAFLDLVSGEELHFMPVSFMRIQPFNSDGSFLACAGYQAVLRWPVRVEPGAPGRLRIGPPESIFGEGTSNVVGSSPDGTIVAVPAGSRGSVLLHRGPSPRQLSLSPQKAVGSCAVSPDGDWVATGSHLGRGDMVKVWEAKTGNLVKTLAIEVGSRASFSPDGRWLATFSPDGRWHATTGGGVRLWAVGTWQEGPVIGGSWPVFSPDGKTIAVAEGVGVVRLVNLDTGKDYARLESTGQEGLEPQCFTPDGTQLIVVGVEDQAIYVWNLRQIREQLAEMGLDWDLPEFPPVGKPRASLAGPLQVRVVDGADEIRQGLERLKAANALLERARTDDAGQRWDDASAAFTKAIELCPDRAPAWEGRGELYARLGLWELAAADLTKAAELQEPAASGHWFHLALSRVYDGDLPGYRAVDARMSERFQGSTDRNFTMDKVRVSALVPDPPSDPARLVELAQAVVAAEPEPQWYHHILGVAHYRAGQYELAIQEFRESPAGDPNWVERPMNYAVLAMAHHRLGHHDEAQQALEDAARAIDQWTQARYQSGQGDWVVNQGASAHWPIDWWNWLECQLFYREARELMGLSPPPDDPRLHVLRARAFAGLRRNFAADLEYAAALKLWPDDLQIRLEAHRSAGYSAVGRRQWSRAAAEFIKASELAPDDASLWRFRAVALLVAEDVDAYRQTCLPMLQRFEKSADFRVAGNVVLVCALRDDALPDTARLLPLARVAAPWGHDGAYALMAALYRAGRYEEAVKCFEAAAKTFRPRASEWSFLAMAHHRLGHADEARRCLAEAARWIDEANRQEEDDLNGTRPAWGGWHEPVVYPLLLREAEELLLGEKEKKD